MKRPFVSALVLAGALAGCGGVEYVPITGSELSDYARVEATFVASAADVEIAVLEQPSPNDSRLLTVLSGVDTGTVKLGDLLCLSDETPNVRADDSAGTPIKPTAITLNMWGEKRTTFAQGSGVRAIKLNCSVTRNGETFVAVRPK
jgi:hypothetical protein